jgi:hypothetical protein
MQVNLGNRWMEIVGIKISMLKHHMTTENAHASGHIFYLFFGMCFGHMDEYVLDVFFGGGLVYNK